MMDVNDDLRALVRTIADYPKPGIQFRDITTLLLDPDGFHATVERMAAQLADLSLDAIAGIEARGFLFASALAYRLKHGVILIRKQNKLPGATVGVNYALEYGQDRIEMHADACRPGMRIALVDDLIATGGTALAAVDLLRGCGAMVAQAAFVIDLPDLGGARRLAAAGVPVSALMAFDGD